MTTTHAGAPATARDALVERLDAHVREVVRREGVDPQADAAVVRRIADAILPEGHRLHVVLEGILRGLQRREHPQVHGAGPAAPEPWSS